MKVRFSQLEARVEALVEGTFARLFAGRIQPRDLSIRLARALEDSAMANSAAPATRYTMRLHPDDATELLEAYPNLGDLLAGQLLELARQVQLILPEPPRVVVVPDPELKPHSVLVTVEGRPEAPSTTQAMTPVRPAAPPPPSKAFLILNGERTVALDQASITLGRRFDSDIVLDDPRVSRTHAQLRLRFGRYVVYDLGSSAGTFVNGQRIDECVLRAGDVISLGGVPVIYGEEESGPNGRPPRPQAPPADTGTRPFRPPDFSPPPDESSRK